MVAVLLLGASRAYTKRVKLFSLISSYREEKDDPMTPCPGNLIMAVDQSKTNMATSLEVRCNGTLRTNDSLSNDQLTSE